MRAARCTLGLLIALAAGPASSSTAEASDADVSVTILPMRQAMVDGDAAKFRAHHWMTDGWAGGLKDVTSHFTLPDGTVITADGHAILNENDFGAEFSVKKDTLGYLAFDYEEFRKYFGHAGGAYRRFQSLQYVDTDKDLALDIGNFGFQTGLTLEGWPELGFGYEREFKDGTKSRLTWTSVSELGESKKIGPSWQDIDEIVDVFEVNANHELAGFTLKGEQRWEFVRSENFRVEQQRTTNTSPQDGKIRTQDQAPEADVMTTTLEADRSFLNDKLHMTSGYHFAHINSREFETLIETNAAGIPMNFSNPEQKPNNRADNDYDSHTWVGSLLAGPWEGWSVGTKLKSEIIRREGYSTYNADTSPSSTTGSAPNGVLNRTEVSLNDSKAVRWGEAATLRFTGIPRTALYTELELEQSRVLMREDRTSIDGPDTGIGTSANEIFNRETVADVRRGTVTMGGRVAPVNALDLTAHVRRRISDNDYDDQRESTASGTALSAFLDSQNVHTDEFATRATYRPCGWFRTSARYQFRDDDYYTRFEAQDTVEAELLSHIYTVDVTLQPHRTVATTASFSRQNLVTTTPARLSGTASNIPAFHADVNSLMLSADYQPVPRLTWTNSVLHSWADNFNDFAETGLPFGLTFDRTDFSTGVTLAVTDQTSVGATYALYTYTPDDNAEFGDYTAHVLWLEGTVKF
jgi:hypothetical protein